MKILNLKRNQTKGFSLVEIMVTTLILGVGMVGAAKFQGDIIKTSTRSQQQMEALNFAKATMEESLHFSTSKQFQAILDTGGGETELEGENATYTAQWSIVKSDNSRGADIALKVNWGTDESIYLTTIASNTTPSAMTLTTMAPSRDPATDPINVAINFPSLDPSNPENSENICRCNGSVAVAFNSTPRSPYAQHKNSNNFVKVSSSSDDDGGGGMMGNWYDNDGDGSDDDENNSDEVVITSTSDECNLCCAEANALAKADQQEQAEKYYAQLEAMMLEKVRLGGDQVISANYFDPRYLRKGYNNVNHDIETYLMNTKNWSGSGDDDSDYDWSSDDGTDDSNVATYTFTAACGIDYDPAPESTVPVDDDGDGADDDTAYTKPIAKKVRCVYFRK